jgi:hypothetical protein
MTRKKDPVDPTIPSRALEECENLTEAIEAHHVSHRQAGIHTETADMRTLQKRLDNPRLFTVKALESLAVAMHITPLRLLKYVLNLPRPADSSAEAAAAKPAGKQARAES